MEQKQIKQLTPEQIKELVRSAQNRQGGAKVNTGKMERNEAQLYPLSKAQERLWFLDSFSEGLPLYNNPLCIKVKVNGTLDPDTLKQAWQDIADRHDILRTTFHLVNDKVMQQVHTTCDIPVTFKDLRSLPDAEKETAIIEEAKEHGNRLFDITKLPLTSLHVLRTTDKEYIYLINAHHLITDGWTNAMLAMELPMLYEARNNMVQPSLPPVNRQFIDYVQYEQDWMKGADYKAQVAFWKEHFREIPPPLSRLSDYPRQADTSYKGTKFTVSIPGGQKNNIITYCKEQNITPFQYLLNAYAILLHRYTGQPDLVIGIPVANRNNIHFQNTLGPFLNTLPVPFHFLPGQLLSEFMATSGNVIQQAIRNQAVPFASLIEELNPRRDTQSNPLFQVHFAYQVFPQLSQDGALSFVPMGIDYEISKFDINIWLEDDGEDWLLSVSYLTDLFQPGTVERLMARYVQLIGLLLHAPDVAVDKLDHISDEDVAVINTLSLSEAQQNRHWLHNFEEACTKYADNIAVADKNGTITYKELKTQADSLAGHLVAAGIAAGSLVALCPERGTDMILCLLALFKIGAAYLPLDAGTPSERLSFILQDAGVQHIICSATTAKEFEGASAEVLLLENLKQLPQINYTATPVAYLPGSLAYVIYTSGTTGKPKGVKISHRSLINYAEAIWERMKLAPGDSFANVSSLAADLGNTMIFPALAYGGTLQIVPEESLTDTWHMAGFFEKHPHDTLKIVPSHLLALLDTDKAAEILPRKLLILGGETCTTALVKKIREISPSLRIINHYGPTEATIGSLTYEVPMGHTSDHLHVVPIGRPLANTSVSLLDSYLQPVAKGSYGEFCLGGANLALGYLNREELEQEKFIPDPDIQGGRLYRTGDHGKLLPDGNIVYMGRMDRQVKIRGYRIELNEVEYTLNTCKGIKQAVILPPAEAHGQQGLTAVISLEENASAIIAWEEAAKNLRSPMLPDRYIVADKIPVTANGKIDYGQLQQLAGSYMPGVKKDQSPRDQAELALLHIWKQVLKIEDLGIEDDFFEAGGHSLLAVKLLAQINEQFGIRLPLSVLFEHNNVKQLSRVIRRGELTASSSPVVMLQPAATKNKMFVLHPAGGNVMSYYPLARELKNQWQVAGIQSVGYAMEHDTGIVELAEYYLAEIISGIKEDEQVVFVGWSMGALIAQHMACLFMEQTGNTPGLVIIDQPAPNEDTHIAATDPVDRLVVFGKKVSQLAGRDLGIHREALVAINEEQRSQLFMEKFNEVGMLPEDIQLSDFHGFLELMIRHNEITMDHRPLVFNGPALVLKAGDRLVLPDVKPQDALHSNDLGWGNVLPDCSVMVVPGNHITMMGADHAKGIADAIASWALVHQQNIYKIA